MGALVPCESCDCRTGPSLRLLHRCLGEAALEPKRPVLSVAQLQKNREQKKKKKKKKKKKQTQSDEERRQKIIIIKVPYLVKNVWRYLVTLEAIAVGLSPWMRLIEILGAEWAHNAVLVVYGEDMEPVLPLVA